MLPSRLLPYSQHLIQHLKPALEELGKKMTLRNQYSFCNTDSQKENIELGYKMYHHLSLHVYFKEQLPLLHKPLWILIFSQWLASRLEICYAEAAN